MHTCTWIRLVWTLIVIRVFDVVSPAPQVPHFRPMQRMPIPAGTLGLGRAVRSHLSHHFPIAIHSESRSIPVSDLGVPEGVPQILESTVAQHAWDLHRNGLTNVY